MIEYWTTWGGEKHDQYRCSRHKTLVAARTAAKACEKVGGAKHKIFKVEKVK